MRRAVFVVVLLATPLVVGQPGASWEPWTQLHGGPDRPGVVDLGPAHLDVVRTFSLFGPERHVAAGNHPGFVATPHGLVALVGDDTVEGTGVSLSESPCRYVTITDARAGNVTTSDPGACDGAMAVVGYDPATDAILVCGFAVGEENILLAVDAATFETRWALTGDDVGIVNPGEPIRAYYLNGDPWYCDGVAIDHQVGEMVVPFRPYDVQQNRIAAVALADGTVRWHTSVTPADLGLPDEVSLTSAGFVAGTVTITDTGIVVTGQSNARHTEALALLNRDGDVVGTAPVERDSNRVADDSPLDMHWWATASGALAAVGIRDQVVIVDPATTQVHDIATLDPRMEASRLRGLGPSWIENTLVLPARNGIVGLDARDLEIRWAWFESWIVGEVWVAEPDDVIVFAGRPVSHGNEASLFRLDLATGAVLQQVPIPLAFDGGFGGLHITPVPGDELVVAWHQGSGSAAVLGRAPDALVPAIQVSTSYPSPGETLTVTAAGPGPAPEAFLVAWGDDVVEQIAPDETAQHTYEDAALRTLRVTALYAEGHTATAESVVHVGGTPPVEQSLAERILAWAGIERLLLVAALGLVAIVAVAEGSRFAHRRRERGREGREERQLAYRRVLAREIEHGAAPEEVAERLRPLRGVLGIADRDHARLEAEARALRVAAAGGARPLVPGERFLERYEVERQLGAGGAGVTYRCRDVRLDRSVVLKVLRTSGDEAMTAALQEARAFAAVHHDRVVTLHDVEQLGDDVYLVLEYVDGPSLAERLADGPLPPDAMVRLADDLLSALEAVHRAGLVHRDVKPANVLVTQDGSCKLGDFGLASAALDDATAVGFTGGAGTARYMAPEQARGERVDARSDLYAAALTLYEAWTGTPYYAGHAGESLVDVHMRAAHGRGSLEGVSAGSALETCFTQALSLDPDDRFQHAAAIRAALLEALEGAEDVRREHGARHARSGDDA